MQIAEMLQKPDVASILCSLPFALLCGVCFKTSGWLRGWVMKGSLTSCSWAVMFCIRNCSWDVKAETQHFLVWRNQANIMYGHITIQGTTQSCLYTVLNICNQTADSLPSATVLTKWPEGPSTKLDAGTQ